jgi:MFS transporter, PPP family, 3-phenylpropionic acid transporter
VTPDRSPPGGSPSVPGAGAQEGPNVAARLSIAYFVYFCAIGIYTPFWSPYLALRGFGPVEIGLLLAVAAGVRSIGPLVFGWLADASGRPTAVLRFAALLSVLSFAALPLLSTLFGFILMMAAFSFGWNSIAPALDARTLEGIGPTSARYGRVRVWGSIGFIVVAWLGGVLFESAGYEWVPVLMMAFVVATLASTLSLGSSPIAPVVTAPTSFRGALRSRPVLVALSVALLISLSFGPYYAFFSLYLESFGVPRSVIGLLWALGVVAEIGVFAAGGPLLAKYSIRTLLTAAAVATAVRWCVIALLPQSLLLLALVQLLHCMGFAVLHFAIVLTAQRLFPADAAARGQALFSSVGYGVGGTLGSIGGGLIWSAISPTAAYLFAAVVVVCAAFCAAVGLRGTALDRPEASASPR